MEGAQREASQGIVLKKSGYIELLLRVQSKLLFLRCNMQCAKCRHENPAGARFCSNCGTKLELVCLKCHKTNPVESNFCNGCGFHLETVDESTPLDLTHPPTYTPRHLAEKILTSRGAIEGERKIVTVLFADVANFTALSEKLDPEEVHQLMDGCFKILMANIHRYEGTINQFTGDGVMALFGAPAALEDHAGRACHAALAIQKAMAGYSEKIRKDTGLDFAMRIGINSGPVIVGAIGDDLRMDYTAVGDTTNLAARLQTSAAPNLPESDSRLPPPQSALDTGALPAHPPAT